MSHRDHHPEYDPDCMGCKLLTISIGAGARENQGVGIREADAKDKALERDLVGYREMRDGGLQPKQIDGSGELVKRVDDQFDIDLGRIVPKEDKSKVRDSFAYMEEMGFAT